MATAATQHRFLRCPPTRRRIEDFVEMAAKHTAPFKKEDAGFRDAIQLWSSIDHMKAATLAAGDNAAFVSGDGRLSENDVAELIAGEGVNLVVEKELLPIIRKVEAQLPLAPQKQLGLLAGLWATPLVESVRRVVAPLVVAKTAGLGLPGTQWEISQVLSEPRVTLEYGATTVAAAQNGNGYDVNFEVRVVFSAICEKPAQISTTSGFKSKITLLIDVDAYIEVGEKAAIKSIDYLRARAFWVFWTDIIKASQAANLVPGVPIFEQSSWAVRNRESA